MVTYVSSLSFHQIILGMHDVRAIEILNLLIVRISALYLGKHAHRPWVISLYCSFVLPFYFSLFPFPVI